MKKALIMVDLQNDFCQGGSLSVPGGDEVIPLANALQDAFPLVIATQDWHPEDHTSFAVNHPGYSVGDIVEVDNLQQILWPAHCVQNSRGAAFHPSLHLKKIQKIIHKGIDKNIDSYSAFFDNAHRRSTGLSDYLQKRKINEIYLLGLATDYCVKYSALDAVHLGFKVNVIFDACRGVELKPGDILTAKQEMQQAGVNFVNSADVLKLLDQSTQ